MEEKNQGRKTAVTWVLVNLAFLVVIGILMFNYIKAGKENGRSAAFDRINASVSSIAEVVNTTASIQSELSQSLADYAVSENCSLGDEATVAFAKSLVDNTSVEHVIFCEGNRVICDESGKGLAGYDLSFCQKNAETEYYLTDESPYGDSVYVVCYTKAQDSKYILSFVSINDMAKRFRSDGYEEYAFLAIYNESTDSAYTFARYSDKESPFLTCSNKLENISACSSDASQNNYFRSNSRNCIAASIEVKMGEDSRVVSATKLGISKWYLILGIRSNYAQGMIERIVSPVRSAVFKLFAVTAIFSMFVITTVILMSAKNKEKGRVLENKADTDLLTDLYNKAATERKIQEYITNNPNGRGLIFVLDIDNFKKINDTMGHAFGDTLLKTLGKEIRSEFRVTDIIGRTGGDEFMVFLKDVTDDVIVEREASRITRFFHDFKAGGDYVKYSATASIGAAIFPDDAKTFKELYVAADQALYRAKKRGKNQLVFYNESEKRR